jgi:hypothetical protein
MMKYAKSNMMCKFRLSFLRKQESIVRTAKRRILLSQE